MPNQHHRAGPLNLVKGPTEGRRRVAAPHQPDWVGHKYPDKIGENSGCRRLPGKAKVPPSRSARLGAAWQTPDKTRQASHDKHGLSIQSNQNCQAAGRWFFWLLSRGAMVLLLHLETSNKSPCLSKYPYTLTVPRLCVAVVSRPVSHSRRKLRSDRRLHCFFPAARGGYLAGCQTRSVGPGSMLLN